MQCFQQHGMKVEPDFTWNLSTHMNRCEWQRNRRREVKWVYTQGI